jgi:hypothetical protein
VTGSNDPTRATRLAAKASGAAVVAFAILWLVTTQVQAIRVLSPFADDPWDAVATYAAIFLLFVAGPTRIRSLRHRGPLLPAIIARRIRWGSGLAGAIVFVAAAVDLQAIGAVGWPAGSGSAAGIITVLVAVTIVAALAALGLVARAAIAARPADQDVERGHSPEPDIVDDLLDLAADVARLLGVRRPVERVAEAVERFLDGSPLSPRRHRLLFGVVLALAAAVAFDSWHAIREGPWASLLVPVIFGILIASGVLAIYLGTLRPLRLLRPPPS